jgi:hypothetical protein
MIGSSRSVPTNEGPLLAASRHCLNNTYSSVPTKMALRDKCYLFSIYWSFGNVRAAIIMQ